MKAIAYVIEHFRIEPLFDKNNQVTLFLNEILSKLNKYVTLIYNLQNNNSSRKTFLQKNKRQKYKYIIEFINN